jgi:hypothetical protein
MTSRSEVGSYAGATSKKTLALRDPSSLTVKQIRQVRAMRREGMDWPAIASTLSVPVLSVIHAGENMKTRHENPKRACLNVSLAARDYFKAKRLPGEPMWKTVNREIGFL